MSESLRELALNILADATEHPDPESPSYEISRAYMDQLMQAAGFRDLEDAERAINPEESERQQRAVRAAMAEGDAGPYEAQH